MNEPILHHYAISPFSEKVRLVFGAKRIAWRSVQVPMLMPKPDVIALTGGYRRTPILQIGADVYCDTALICRLLDRMHPAPPLYPSEIAGTAQMLAQWADRTLFWAAVPYTMQPKGVAIVFDGVPPETLKAFAADRAAFAPRERRVPVADATVALHSYLGWLEGHLADDRGFLVRGQLSIADFSVAHCLWAVHLAPPLAAIYGAYPKVSAWLARVRAFGHGERRETTSADALGVAAGARSHAPVEVESGLGFEAGAAVSVAAVDYGTDPVAGRLVGLTRDQATIERRDERAGTLHVHFPRLGFQIRRADA